MVKTWAMFSTDTQTLRDSKTGKNYEVLFRCCLIWTNGCAACATFDKSSASFLWTCVVFNNCHLYLQSKINGQLAIVIMLTTLNAEMSRR